MRSVLENYWTICFIKISKSWSRKALGSDTEDIISKEISHRGWWCGMQESGVSKTWLTKQWYQCMSLIKEGLEVRLCFRKVKCIKTSCGSLIYSMAHLGLKGNIYPALSLVWPRRQHQNSHTPRRFRFCTLQCFSIQRNRERGWSLRSLGWEKSGNGLVSTRVVALEQEPLRSTHQDKGINLKRAPTSPLWRSGPGTKKKTEIS